MSERLISKILGVGETCRRYRREMKRRQHNGGTFISIFPYFHMLICLSLSWNYFRSYLTRLPNYDSTRCRCSKPIQTARHLLLGCPLYKEERKRAGIGRETTLQSLPFPLKGIAALIDFIQETRVATRSWLLQGVRESDEEDTWGWGSLQDAQERDGEELD